jgi:peptide/nickel transport system permease protein
VRGDFGESSAFGEPVGALIAARAWVTVKSALSGFVAAWGMALLVCVLGHLRAGRWLRTVGSGIASVVVCVPSAVIAFWCVALGLTVGTGIGIVVFPRVLRYSDNLLSRAMEESFVISARCRGASEIRVVLNHALRDTAPQLVTLAGVTFTLAFGAAIPMEVLADSAGLGQLAWRGALARDLALVVSVTFIIGSVTLLANTAARSFTDLITGVREL